MLETWKRDLTRAARSLFRAPACTTIAVLTLAGSGTSTALGRPCCFTMLRVVPVIGRVPGMDDEEGQVGVLSLSMARLTFRASAVHPNESIRTE